MYTEFYVVLKPLYFGRTPHYPPPVQRGVKFLKTKKIVTKSIHKLYDLLPRILDLFSLLFRPFFIFSFTRSVVTVIGNNFYKFHMDGNVPIWFYFFFLVQICIRQYYSELHNKLSIINFIHNLQHDKTSNTFEAQ